jgi:hypothetical protein
LGQGFTVASGTGRLEGLNALRLQRLNSGHFSFKAFLIVKEAPAAEQRSRRLARLAADDSCTIEGHGFAPKVGAALYFRTAESAAGA